MFNLNSLYRIKVLKLHHLCFFYENSCKNIEKLILCHKASMRQNAKSRQKLEENLKVYPYPNYAVVIIKFCLFISLE